MKTVKQNSEKVDNAQNNGVQGRSLNESFRGVHIEISSMNASHKVVATEGVTYFEIYGILKVVLAKLENDLGIVK